MVFDDRLRQSSQSRRVPSPQEAWSGRFLVEVIAGDYGDDVVWSEIFSNPKSESDTGQVRFTPMEPSIEFDVLEVARLRLVDSLTGGGGTD